MSGTTPRIVILGGGCAGIVAAMSLPPGSCLAMSRWSGVLRKVQRR